MKPNTKNKSTQGVGPQALEPPRRTALLPIALGLLLSAVAAWGQPVLHPTFPKDVLVSSGEKRVTFTVQATGYTGTLEYWWFHEQNEIQGATNTSLVLTNFQAIDAGSYYALVTDASKL